MKRTMLIWALAALLAGCGEEMAIGESENQLTADDDAGGAGSNDDDTPNGNQPGGPGTGNPGPSDDDDDGTLNLPGRPDDDSTEPDDDVGGDDDSGEPGDDDTEPDDDDAEPSDDDAEPGPSVCGNGICEPGEQNTCATIGEIAGCEGCVADCGGDNPAPECPTQCPPPPPVCEPCEGSNECARYEYSCNDDGSCGAGRWVCSGPGPGEQCPRNCALPAICQLCDDGSCAQPEIDCSDDGSCGAVSYSCSDEEPPECPTRCPVPRICHGCDDGTCAQAQVACNDDGSCGEISWKCQDKPGPVCPPEGCPVNLVCHLCDDGSCAVPNVAQDENCECGEVTWECPSPTPKCSRDEECDVTLLLACQVCLDGSEVCPTMGCVNGECAVEFSGCDVHTDPGPGCNQVECLRPYECVRACGEEPFYVGCCPCPEDAIDAFIECRSNGGYDPCAGKQEGETCMLCPPPNPDETCTFCLPAEPCFESGEIKTCQNGQCRSAGGSPGNNTPPGVGIGG